MKLHLICSNDKMRPEMHFVKITKTQMIATNGWVAGVIPTNSLFDDDFINDIPEDGILVHSEDFSKISQGLFFKWKVPGEILKIINSKKRDILIEVEKGTFPDILKCVPKKLDGITDAIGINFSQAKLLQDALGFQSCKIQFSDESKVMYITDASTEKQNFGLLMPIEIKK